MHAADELADPVGYSSLWGWLAVAAVLLVVLWYVGVALWARRGRPRPVVVPVATARERALAALDEVHRGVASGQLADRDGYQRTSTIVRTFVADTTGLPTHTMALADLREAGVPHLAETVALMYPPEFAPAGTPAAEPIDATLHRARELVASWT